ncbi:helix-turn-helix domain-containing protein [Paenibacillus lautus]|uniref:helix-turn-helix domain-containing protein n=1 Tax=Paenibacillus lautus TaxID=1401 RepID=UPI001BCB8783|nr:AraC family transcriptional regulator [Paenibacillus lautus]
MIHNKNFVLHASSNQFYWQGVGQLSIKTFRSGKVHYRTNRGYFAVEEHRYLLLNPGFYDLLIDQEKDVESFCLFFREELAGEVLRTLVTSTNDLLTDPYRERDSVNFFEKTYCISSILSKQLESFKDKIPVLKHDELWMEEQYISIMQTLVIEQLNTYKEIDNLHALRKSTREELYRRISFAHEYVRAYYNKPITLNEIARSACLSPNHLLRNYASLFRKTPFQHITELRIEKALQLLSRTEWNITEISHEIGYENPVSLTKMFRQHVGVSPSQYRKKVILAKT